MDTQFDNTELARIKWACRRGMLELDLLLFPFFEQHYSKLSLKQKNAFIQLLTNPDPDIFNWLMGYQAVEDPELFEIVEKIRYANH